MSGNKFTVDTSQWPVTVTTYDGTVSDAEFMTYLAELEGTLQRKEPYWAIIDARNSAVPPPRQRQLKIEWLRHNIAALQLYCSGAAFVIDSSILRGVLSALLWVVPFKFPYTIVSTVDKARAWIDHKASALTR